LIILPDGEKSGEPALSLWRPSPTDRFGPAFQSSGERGRSQKNREIMESNECPGPCGNIYRNEQSVNADYPPPCVLACIVEKHRKTGDVAANNFQGPVAPKCLGIGIAKIRRKQQFHPRQGHHPVDVG
jgi:hypothetical protein